MTGRFAQAFEHNQFWEGPFSVQPDPWEIPTVGTKLHIERPPLATEIGERVGTVSEITFEGRRPLCVVMTEEVWLMVDRIISEEIVSTQYDF